MKNQCNMMMVDMTITGRSLGDVVIQGRLEKYMTFRENERVIEEYFRIHRIVEVWQNSQYFIFAGFPSIETQ